MLPVKVKICGLREPANILEAAALEPDYLGFVFYRPSPRYAGAPERAASAQAGMGPSHAGAEPAPAETPPTHAGEEEDLSAGEKGLSAGQEDLPAEKKDFSAGERDPLSKLQATLAGLQKIKKTAVFVNEPLESALEIAGRLGMDAVQLHGSESPEYCRAMKEQGFELIKAFGVGEDFDFALTRPYEAVCDHFLFDSRTRGHGGSGKAFGWEQLERYSGSRTFFLSGGLDLDNLPQALELSTRLPVTALDLNSCFESAPGLKDIEKLSKAIRLIRPV